MKLELSISGETGRIDLLTLNSILGGWQKILSQFTQDKCTLSVETIIANSSELKLKIKPSHCSKQHRQQGK